MWLFICPKKHQTNSTVLNWNDVRHSPTGPGGPWGPGTGAPRESWNVFEKKASFRRSGVKKDWNRVLMRKSFHSLQKPNSSTWELKTEGLLFKDVLPILDACLYVVFAQETNPSAIKWVPHHVIFLLPKFYAWQSFFFFANCFLQMKKEGGVHFNGINQIDTFSLL